MTPIAQNRDIIFDFRDSCNCCAWRKPNPGQRMYVHTNGDVTPFSTRKSRAESAAERTFAHVIQLVQRVTSQHRISTTTSEQMVCDTGLTHDELPTREMLQRLQHVVADAIARFSSEGGNESPVEISNESPVEISNESPVEISIESP